MTQSDYATSAKASHKRSGIQSRLLSWFALHKRDLPWRILDVNGRRDPYRVWLAEVMLQQTQVVTALPYFKRWLARFPTLQALAKAPLDDVLKQWEGLGYYARARNFHKAVQTVQQDYAGQLPHTVDELLKLPGIGRYTAGAVASLAFDQDAPVLDGNVKRVLSRLFAIGPAGESGVPTWMQSLDDAELRDQLAEESNPVEALWTLSTWLVPQGYAGAFNEALMDLGATLCTPRSPDCPHCPVQVHCAAYAQGKPEAYPAKKAARATPHKHMGTAVLTDPNGRMLMGQRPVDGLLGGLWEFVSDEVSGAASPEVGLPLFGISLAGELTRIVQARVGLPVTVNDADFIGTVRHTFTHFTMTKHVAVVRVGDTADTAVQSSYYTSLRWVTAEQARLLALTRSDQKILAMVEKM